MKRKEIEIAKGILGIISVIVFALVAVVAFTGIADTQLGIALIATGAIFLSISQILNLA